MSFHVLGPLEVRVAGEELVIGGAKQRAVLAVLLLRTGEVVSVERLVDEVWGDEPPPSAAHTLESYVSRLRRLFNDHGPRLVRRGAGYALELGEATLDARAFIELQERASLAAAMDEHAEVVELMGTALAMWRGPALADVALASAGRAEAHRLEELRLRTYELRFDAELALGRHEQVIGELQKLVVQNPYRERFVAQLMVALYRAGRHAEALDVYERTRTALSDDLGLQPSVELQQLSGQIVRQDPQLRGPTGNVVTRTPMPRIRHRARRMAELVLVGSCVAAAMAFTASGSAPRERAPDPMSTSAKRVAFVVPQAPASVTASDARLRWSLDGFTSAEGWGHETEILVSGETAPKPAELERVLRRIEQGRFDFVLVLGGGDTARGIADDLVRELPATRFAFIDASLSALSLQGVKNATGMRFADEQSSQLAGYLSGLMPPRGAAPREQVDMVSVVAAEPSARTRRLVAGFTKGVRRALPHAAVRVDYSHELVDPTRCELLANRQIDRGSDVVYALSGKCSRGALAVAQVRGVWGIRAEEDGAPNGQHILATTTKYWTGALITLINDFQFGTLPAGEDVVLGLNDDYAVSLETADRTDAVWSKVVQLCSSIRQHLDAKDA